MERYILNLGSNRPGRFRYILSAAKRLEGLGALKSLSRLYLTEPVGPSWSWFLNLSLLLETDLKPLGLLEAVKGIERLLGRSTPYRWGPREIDIDIILWDKGSFNSPELVIPHISYQERAFVLVPLMDLSGLEHFGMDKPGLARLVEKVKSKRVIPLYTASKYLYLKVKVGG